MTMAGQTDDEQDAIDRAASAWLVRIEEDGLDADAKRDFDRWLAEDPRHKATYAAMRETWSDIARMPELAVLAPDHPPRAAGRTLWRWAAGMAVAASLAAGLFFYQTASLDPHYRTEIAETRTVALPDGSSVTLGARSSITLVFKADERRVILSSGEALFDVVHDASRPFVVDAGSSMIRDIGTRFNVNRTSSSVRIGVLEGRVEVRRTDAATVAPVTLGRGQGAQVVQAANPSLSGPIVVTTQEAPGAWRDGRLVFDNVRLADLSADVNRYYAPGVTLGSAAVGDLRVTAAFRTSEIPAFMGALDATLPVRTERSPDGRFRIVDARK
jgi:transmembrane sensor